MPQQLQVRNPNGLKLTLGRNSLLTKPVMWIFSLQYPIQLLTDGYLLRASASLIDLMAWARVRSELGSQPGWSCSDSGQHCLSVSSRVSALMGSASLTFFHFHLPTEAISEQSENCSLWLTWPFICSHEQLPNQAACMACWELCTPRHSPCLEKCSWWGCTTGFNHPGIPGFAFAAN